MVARDFTPHLTAPRFRAAPVARTGRRENARALPELVRRFRARARAVVSVVPRVGAASLGGRMRALRADWTPRGHTRFPPPAARPRQSR